jgi:putative hydrolase of the HAD superfamily
VAALADLPLGPPLREWRLLSATGCFSNMNDLHWRERVAAWPLADMFDHRFLSFELGLLKPDVAAFAKVADLTRVPAGRILFLDDNAMNVAGARAAGLQAARVRGVDDARQRLVEAAVI